MEFVLLMKLEFDRNGRPKQHINRLMPHSEHIKTIKKIIGSPQQTPNIQPRTIAPVRLHSSVVQIEPLPLPSIK